MDTPKIFDSELKLCEILWQHQPVKSSELVRLCADQLGWKKSTTYTVLKRLCDRGIFQNQSGTVTALLSKGELAALQSEQFVAEAFSGSLPAFLAAFAQGAPLSQKDIADIRALIDRFEQEGQT